MSSSTRSGACAARAARASRGVGRDLDLVALLGEDLLQQAADIRLVVHHQYSRSGHTRSLLCSALARLAAARAARRRRPAAAGSARAPRPCADYPPRCARRAPRRSSSRSRARGPCPWACWSRTGRTPCRSGRAGSPARCPRPRWHADLLRTVLGGVSFDLDAGAGPALERLEANWSPDC